MKERRQKVTKGEMNSEEQKIEKEMGAERSRLTQTVHTRTHTEALTSTHYTVTLSHNVFLENLEKLGTRDNALHTK